MLHVQLYCMVVAHSLTNTTLSDMNTTLFVVLVLLTDCDIITKFMLLLGFHFGF